MDVSTCERVMDPFTPRDPEIYQVIQMIEYVRTKFLHLNLFMFNNFTQ